MARFSCNDLEGFILDMEEMAELSGDAVDAILSAGAEVVRKSHVDEINRTFDKHTAKLIGSPTVYLKTGTGKYGHAVMERYALIYPEGEHHTYRAKGGGTGSARNADIGFVHEFGGHGNKPTNWMWNADERCAGEMADAEERAYDDWLKSHKL